MSDSKQQQPQQQQSKEDADHHHHQTPNSLFCNEDKSPLGVVKQQSPQGSAAGAGGAVCGVCKRLYRDPKILPCLHTFCSDCIVQLEPFSVSQQQQGPTGTKKKTTPSTSNTNRPAATTWTSSSSSPSSSSSRSSSNGSEDPPPSSHHHHHHVGDGKTSVLCPECDTEVDIPPSGVGGLSTDHLALDAVFSETLMADGSVVCDLCSDGDAERRCEVCSVNLCEFCSQAHRRQKRTASHTVRCLQELKGQTGRVSRPVLCSFHPGQELRLFCEPCDLPVCIECSATFHRDPSQHRCCPARDVIDRHGGRIRQLVSGCLRPRLERLEEALRTVESSQETLHTRVEAVAVEVRAFARGYANAVETHCVSLLRRLEEVRVQRRNQLHLQKAQLQQALADVRGGVDFAERLLTSGSEAEILSAKGVTLRRLGGLAETGYDPAHPAAATGGRGAAAAPPPGPGPDDDGSSICFLPREGAGEVQGFPVVGVIYSKTLDLSRCTIEGEGLQQCREGQRGAFSLVCRDSAGEQMGRGGDNVLVSIIHKDKKDCTVEAAVVDNCDGSYAVSYTPVEPGLYSVWVCVKAQHVKSSPFVLSVQRKLRRHRGTFHCCSFCSGGGSKQSQCGCPGTMPGGFQGCGHGHKGHPGKPHWSCCGSTAEQSECLPRSIMAAVSPRGGRLRTVEL